MIESGERSVIPTNDGWIVKGAVALIARGLGVRGSLDIDVYREVAKDVAVADVQKAATLDVDWVSFERTIRPRDTAEA